MLSVSSSPDPITSRWLRPRSAALRLSQLGAGYARLPQWGRETFPKPHPSLDSSRCFMSNQPVTTFRVNLSEALHTASEPPPIISTSPRNPNPKPCFEGYQA